MSNIDVRDSLCEYYYSIPDYDTYTSALSSLDIQSVFTDLFELLLTDDSYLATDGGLFLRLGWDAAGTFRDTDGEGGAAGGGIRFPSESSWMDNANVDMLGH